IADADVVEKGQPLADLLDDPRADQLLDLGQLERVQELKRAEHRHLRELVDVPAADRHREHLGLQPRALAGRARPERHVLLDPLPLLRRVWLAIAPLEARYHPLEGEHVGATPPSPGPVRDGDAIPRRANTE